MKVLDWLSHSLDITLTVMLWHGLKQAFHDVKPPNVFCSVSMT